MTDEMRKKLLEIANEHSWNYYNGTDRCRYCGAYGFTGKHEEDCPLEVLLLLIKESE